MSFFYGEETIEMPDRFSAVEKVRNVFDQAFDRPAPGISVADKIHNASLEALGMASKERLIFPLPIGQIGGGTVVIIDASASRRPA